MMKRWQERWLEATELDLRTLAVVRILLGLLLCWIQLQYLWQAEEFFSDSGFFPRTKSHFDGFLSLHGFFGEANAQKALFVLGALAGLALAAGVKTKWVTPIAWYLTASSQDRNSLILQGGDIELKMVLFFMIFIPWGAAFSWDAWRRQQGSTKNYRYQSFANTALLVQIALVYWAAVGFKTGPEWREGTAVFFALHHSSYATTFADLILGLPLGVLKSLTYLVLISEACGPFLFFLGFWARLVAMIGFLFLHLGFGLSFVLTTFSFISGACAAVIFPSKAWDFVLKVESTVLRRAWGWRDAFVLTVLSIVIGINVLGTSGISRKMLPGPVRFAADKLALYQQWFMFAKVDRKDRGFYRILGVDDNQKTWSYFEDREVMRNEIPVRPSATYPSMEWKRALNAIIRRDVRSLEPLGAELCERMKEKASQNVLIFNYRRNLEFGEPASEYRQKLVLDYSCIEKRAFYDVIKESRAKGTKPQGEGLDEAGFSIDPGDGG